MVTWNSIVGSIGLAAGALACLTPLATTAAPSNVAAWRHDGLTVAVNPNLTLTQSLGHAVGTAGDFDCDGVADLLIGDYGSDFDANGGWVGADLNPGWLAVYFGDRTLPPQPTGAPGWVFVPTGFGGSQPRVGARVAAGDVNADGCDDVISLSAGEATTRVQIFLGSPSGPGTSPAWTRFVSSVAHTVVGAGEFVIAASLASGDVNGDGAGDVVLGLPMAANGGQVNVWLGSQSIAGSPTGSDDPDWIASGGQSGAEFGWSVSAGGDVNGDGRDDILVGAKRWDGPGATDGGRAFLWFGSPVLASAADGTAANASWSLQIGIAQAHLGRAVAILGDVDGDGFADIAVGAPNYDNPFVTGTAEGIVLVTRGASPAPPNELFDWTHPGLQSAGALGYSLASAGDVNGDGRADYLIGEPGFRTGGNKQGRAQLLLGRPTSAWGPNPVADVSYFESSSECAGTSSTDDETCYGVALGTAGDWNDDGYSDVVVGAPRNSRVFVYLGRGDTLASAPVTLLRADQADAAMGLGLAFAGDINADGFTDIVAGAPNWEDSGSQDGEGRVFVGFGGPCGPACAPISELPGGRDGNQAGASLGWSVSGAGDVNGDGFADVVAGAPLMNANIPFCVPINDPGCQRADVGQARIYMGGPGGLPLSDSLRINGAGQTNAQFGYSVASAGDVNGDGFGDVIVGAPFANAGFANEGSVFLYLGSPSGLSSTPSWSKNGGQSNARFGIDVAGAGDVNGDGFSDVIIGATGAGTTGAAYVYLGRPTTPLFPQGLWNTPIRTLVGPQADSAFGITVASAGDVNRDGLADVVVGAPEFDDDPEFGPQIGAVFVYHGGAPAGPAANPSTSIFGGFPGPGFANRFGNGVAGAGDVNGDGFDDLIVGDQWLEGPAGFAQGRADVFHGGPSGLATLSSRSFMDCPTSFCDFGRDVAGQGDVDGDGFGDVLIAAYAHDVTFSNEGAVFVHLGNEGRGRPVRPLQSLGFGGPTRAILGITPDVFDVSMDRRNPAGRGRVDLEVEVKPLGQAFDGTGLIKTGMVDNGFEPRGTVTRVGNAPNDKFYWRARLRSLSPLFGRSRWISLPGNGARELDIRVVPEPGLLAGLSIGIAGLAALGRRGRRRVDRADAPRRNA